MTDAPTPHGAALDPKTLAKRRVLGIPVLYLIGGAVLLLALYAWKAKAKAPAKAADTPAEEDVTDAGDYVPSDGLFPTLPTGTVVTAPSTSTTADNANSSIDTNSEWLTRGVAYLGTKGIGGGAAQGALQAYLTGVQLSTVQGRYRDMVVAELGLPPDPVDLPDPASASEATSYIRRTGTAALYRALPDGSLDWIDRAEWDAAGRPSPTDIPATDPVWLRPVVGGPDAPDAFKTGMGQ